MNWMLVGCAVILLLGLFFGAKEGIWDASVTLVTLLLFLFMMNLVLPPMIGDMDIKDEFLLESTLNEEKDVSYLISLLPDQVESKILHGYSSYNEVLAADQELASMIVGKLASFGVIIAMIIALLFALFVLRPIGAMYDFLSKFPILKRLDRVIGTVLGLINGMMIIYMIFIGVAMYASTEIGGIMRDLIYQSELLVSLYENNLIIKIFF